MLIILSALSFTPQVCAFAFVVAKNLSSIWPDNAASVPVFEKLVASVELTARYSFIVVSLLLSALAPAARRADEIPVTNTPVKVGVRPLTISVAAYVPAPVTPKMRLVASTPRPGAAAVIILARENLHLIRPKS